MAGGADGRLILAIDLDYFYAACEIIADPTLTRDMPVGVQQKQIIVTCNYPARERGVKKLQLLKDSLAACPDLVVRDGSDIQKYRRASTRIWEVLARAIGVWGTIWQEAGLPEPRLVTSEVSWPEDEPPLDPAVVDALATKLERLGLDEFFLDVTALVDHHLSEAELVAEDEEQGEGCWFALPLFRDPVNPSFVSTGFRYHPFNLPRDTQLIGDSSSGLPRRLLAAAHLARHLRELLRKLTRFTTSCGISSSKVLAKLASDVRKPDGQSILPDAAREGFISTIEIGRFQGIGWKMRRDLEEWLGGRSVNADGTHNASVPWPAPEDVSKKRKRPVGVEVDIDELPDDAPYLEGGDMDSNGFDAGDDAQMALLNPANWHSDGSPRLPTHSKLTPSHLLPILTKSNPPPSLTALLDRHPSLLPLLNGIDETPVKMTTLPISISIEDSFRCHGTADAWRRLADLVTWLIERLEEEEMTEPNSPEGLKRKWRRFPRTLRLSLRRRSLPYHASRESKTIATPYSLLDTATDMDARVAKTVRAIEGPFRALLLAHPYPGSTEAERLDAAAKDMVILNLAVTGFQKEWAQGSADIGKFLVRKEPGAAEPAPEGGQQQAKDAPPAKPFFADRPEAVPKDKPVPAAVLEKLGIDPKTFAELPPEIRAEILRNGTPQDGTARPLPPPRPEKRKGGPMDRFLRQG
ncbi:hypothetical protein DFJ74DRAFT_488963 [Hyaloraphidium curvatum]|nr:hypothetical protein DFJ74DRAFT_488963 [Hyaloraphidium curvatum]